MSLFKLSNSIFDMKLDAQELAVYAYLCSIEASECTLNGESVVHVKQATIGEKCAIRSLQTVRKILRKLSIRGLINPLNRLVKHNGQKGTYFYGIKKQPLSGGYFYVNRKVWGALKPRQMMIYLFICKSWDALRNDCWNSFQDIANQTGMKREQVIKTIKELTASHFIVRIRHRAKDHAHVYVDNHYQVVQYVQGKIKRKVRLHAQYNRTDATHSAAYHNNLIVSHFQRFVKPFSVFSFFSRGSPQNVHHKHTQSSLLILKEKNYPFMITRYSSFRHLKK